MGVLNETVTLSYGKVFVQLQLSVQTAFAMGVEREHIVTGNVFVALNPCLHPGNV